MAEKPARPEPTYYKTWYPKDEHTEGSYISVKRALEFSEWNVEKSDLAELVKLPEDELTKRRGESVGAEKAAFEQMQALAQTWQDNAVRTMLLDRALEYARTPEVTHTSNEWKRYGEVWEISNKVYKMRYTIQEQKTGAKKGQWLVTWGIAINKPRRPSSEKHYYYGDAMVVDEKKKYYNAEADAQNYIQGRFNVYAHLFRELSPPIPYPYRRLFHINGILLPGYTVEPPERTTQEVANELLNLLDDEDLTLPEQPPAQTLQTQPKALKQEAGKAVSSKDAEKPAVKGSEIPKTTGKAAPTKDKGGKKAKSAPER